MTTLKKPVKKTKKTAAKKKAVKSKVAKKVSLARKSAPKKGAKVVARKKAVKKKLTKAPLKGTAAKKAVKKAVTKKVATKKTVAKKATAKKLVRNKSVVVKKPTIAATPPKPSYPALVQSIINQLDDSKAEAIVTINLEHKSTMADWMIVASGRSDRHVNAIANQTVEQLHKHGLKNIRVEGMPQCDWVLVDSGDVIIHVFRPEVRSFYNLEKLWSGERR